MLVRDRAICDSPRTAHALPGDRRLLTCWSGDAPDEPLSLLPQGVRENSVVLLRSLQSRVP